MGIVGTINEIANFREALFSKVSQTSSANKENGLVKITPKQIEELSDEKLAKVKLFDLNGDDTFSDEEVDFLSLAYNIGGDDILMAAPLFDIDKNERLTGEELSFLGKVLKTIAEQKEKREKKMEKFLPTKSTKLPLYEAIETGNIKNLSKLLNEIGDDDYLLVRALTDNPSIHFGLTKENAIGRAVKNKDVFKLILDKLSVKDSELIMRLGNRQQNLLTLAIANHRDADVLDMMLNKIENKEIFDALLNYTEFNYLDCNRDCKKVLEKYAKKFNINLDSKIEEYYRKFPEKIMIKEE